MVAGPAILDLYFVPLPDGGAIVTSRVRHDLAANRDEFYSRPTERAAFWPDAPNILAGRDLQGGGTWLGLTRTGRFAALTNYRDFRHPQHGERSRGLLVSDFLQSDAPPADYLDRLSRSGAKLGDFNLLVGDRHQLWYYSNRGTPPLEVPPGIHGLSNHLLDTPWPKVAEGSAALAALLRRGPDRSPTDIFLILANRQPAADRLLPDTGVGRERERLLSSAFIASPEYGTRSSTLLFFSSSDMATFIERTFDAPDVYRDCAFRFPLLAPPPARGGI